MGHSIFSAKNLLHLVIADFHPGGSIQLVYFKIQVKKIEVNLYLLLNHFIVNTKKVIHLFVSIDIVDRILVFLQYCVTLCLEIYHFFLF
jgi:hypothetical protein